MTSTNFNVGLGNADKTSSKIMTSSNGDCHENLFGADFKGSPCHHRVLKPPGGGSSDIFGASESVERSPRRVRNHLQSSVLGGTIGTVNGPETPARVKNGNDSYNRLFGSVEARPPSTIKNRQKSNIPIGIEDQNSPPKNGIDNNCLKAYVRRNPVTGIGVIDRDSYRRCSKKRDAISVNGEKPAAVTNGDSLSSDCSTTTSNSSASSASQPRNRVPPGGFSSGLW